MVQRKYCDKMVLNFFCYLVSTVFLPSTLASLPPGVMLLNCRAAPRDSATDIKKISLKGASEGEQPNRNVVKKYAGYPEYIALIILSKRAPI